MKQGGRTKVEGRNKNIHFYKLGLKENGRKIIDLLLDKSIGHGRVLIDTKHMSRQARIDFRDLIKQHNAAHPEDLRGAHENAEGRRKAREHPGIGVPADVTSKTALHGSFLVILTPIVVFSGRYSRHHSG